MPRSYKHIPMNGYGFMQKAGGASLSAGASQQCTCFPETAASWQTSDNGANSLTITMAAWFRVVLPEVAGTLMFNITDPSRVSTWTFGETVPNDPSVAIRMVAVNASDQIRFTAFTNRVTQSTQIDILDEEWHHVVWSANGVDAIHCVVDGVLQVLSATTVNLNGSPMFHEREQGINGSSFSGCISDYYWHSDYIDLSVEANRKKFYNNGWVYYGDKGDRPQGSQPTIWLRDADADFGTNYGTRDNLSIVTPGVGGSCTV